ncbi:alpha/beta hydrolase [Dendronalium sp. ChiSLP03b]|uniref:alpha/beta fold hydrolase n=1 Tax=Dendronalium sp. ChiSLP03b TaxID=3075381 RepID=UPI002AD44613|nr:alpha/beta hydrolase [Dendronalium sp. ChiSLP03b]MDZ8209324.1 alpha/beta hydrolase [Dendronalium sp. ChiSLP03b]
MVNQRNFQRIETNGVRLNTVVEGHGPLIILLHGWPQSWDLWRNQIDPLVQAGFQVAVPNQRGYNGSDAPQEIEAYSILNLTADVAGIADALGHDTFIVVGHDWGAPVAWNTALLYEQRVRAVVGMSVPYFRYPVGALTKQENFGDKFWYMVYFQKPGVAEAEFERDIRRSLRMIHYNVSGSAPAGIVLNPKSSTSGFLDGLIDPEELPQGMTAEDLDYYVEQYTQSGFRGNLNWYRNIDRNIEITPQLEGKKISQPALFIAGEKDIVLKFPGINLDAMTQLVPNLKGQIIVPGAGHWVPAEYPQGVNEALVAFVKEFA